MQDKTCDARTIEGTTVEVTVEDGEVVAVARCPYCESPDIYNAVLTEQYFYCPSCGRDVRIR